MDDICSICLDPLNDDQYSLQCNHKFHTHCIINWFRSNHSSGNCPLCNDNPFENNQNDYNFYYNVFLVDERCKVLKKYSRKKIATANLKKEVQKLKILEQKYNQFKKEKNNFFFSDEIKNIRKILRKYQRDNSKYFSKLQKQKCKIVSLYPTIIL